MDIRPFNMMCVTSVTRPREGEPRASSQAEPAAIRARLLVSRLFIHEILGLNGSLRRISVPTPLFADAAEGKYD